MKPALLTAILDSSSTQRSELVNQLAASIQAEKFSDNEVRTVLNHLMLMLIEEKDNQVYENVMKLLSELSEIGLEQKKIEGFVASHIKSMKPGAAAFARTILTSEHVEQRSNWLNYFQGLEKKPPMAQSTSSSEVSL